MRWSYGVMTVPERRDTYLRCTLASLRAGGFNEPRIFVDGADDSLGWSKFLREAGMGCLPVSCRSPRLGVVGNWMMAMWELHLREPQSDRYLLFQDDMITVRNLRTYLERRPYPAGGYCNLYTFTQGNEDAIAGKPTGWHQAGLTNPPDRNPYLWQTGRGAVALMFDREAIVALLSSRPLVEKIWAADAKIATKRIDGGVVNAMNKAGYREYVHAPSLVQHSGEISTIGNQCDAVLGLARTFPGEDFDALDLID